MTSTSTIDPTMDDPRQGTQPTPGDEVPRTPGLRRTAHPPGPVIGGGGRIDAIDGLRAIAILSIVVYHSGVWERGILGVDVFFALSGFLITLMLVRELERRRRVRLADFYARRVKRLLPALVLTLALTGLAVWLFGLPHEADRFGAQALAALLHVANWEQILQNEAYWSGLEHAGPLAHMWSLSITEQFYLLWPPLFVLVICLVSRGSDEATSRALLAATGVAALLTICAAIAPAIAFDGTNHDAIYLGTPTHGAGLAAGTLAALLLASARRWRHDRGRSPSTGRSRLGAAARTAVGSAGIATIVGMSLAAENYRADWLYTWGFAAAAVSAAVLCLALSGPSPLARALSVRPLIAIGRVSYTVFLIHLPLFWLLRALKPQTPPSEILIVGGVASLLLAGIIHHAFAERIRLRRWHARGTVVFVAVFATVAAFVWAVPALSRTAIQPAAGTAVLTLGDSLAHDFAAALQRSGGDYRVVDGGIGGCGITSPEMTGTPAQPELPVPRGCLPWEDRWRSAVIAERPDVVIVTLGWDAVRQRIDGRWTDASEPGFRELYLERLERLTVVFAGTGARVLLTKTRVDTNVASPEAARAHGLLLEEFAHANPGYRLLDLDGYLCSTGRCARTTPDGMPMYLDTVHFTQPGLDHLSPWLAAAIEELHPSASTHGSRTR